MVSHIEEGTQAEGDWEQGTDENIWTEKGECNRKLKEIMKCYVIYVIFIYLCLTTLPPARPIKRKMICNEHGIGKDAKEEVTRSAEELSQHLPEGF